MISLGCNHRVIIVLKNRNKQRSINKHMNILEAYRTKTPSSEGVARKAEQFIAGGVTSDTRYFLPYGLCIERGLGALKYDVDGNEYLDFFGGHGSLILGHNHPDVIAATRQAVEQGWQYAATHPGEAEWAQKIVGLIPSAEKVRFTASGTEATLLAMRLARAYTGRPLIVRFKGHYHGWHDHACFGYLSHFDGTATVGVLPSIADNIILLRAGDREALQQAFEQHGRQIAAVIIEPTGSHFGNIPMPSAEVLGDIETLTHEHKSLFILDEVLAGFRVTRGGAQAYYGVTPDLTPLGKVVTGGMPGGALTGKSEIMNLVDVDYTQQHGLEKVMHQGTFNAHPVAAAAGMATLDIVARTDVSQKINALASKMRDGLNNLFEEESLPWAYYGEFSDFHLFVNPMNRPLKPSQFDANEPGFDEYREKPLELLTRLRMALLLEGVDLNRHCTGFMSAAHTEADVARALSAYGRAIYRVKQEVNIHAT